MDISKKIRTLLDDEDISLKSLAILLNTSPNNLYNKLRRNDLRINEVEHIAKSLGYSVKLEFIKLEE